jgi:hypothetical protein
LDDIWALLQGNLTTMNKHHKTHLKNTWWLPDKAYTLTFCQQNESILHYVIFFYFLNWCILSIALVYKISYSFDGCIWVTFSSLLSLLHSRLSVCDCWWHVPVFTYSLKTKEKNWKFHQNKQEFVFVIYYVQHVV